VQTPEAVVETALKALARGKGHIVSGWANYLMVQAERLAPRSIIARAAGAALRPQYGNKISDE
jgi:short-subunit dehydrogenase